MKVTKALPIIAVSLLFPAGGALAASATASLMNTDGKQIGTVEFKDTASDTILVTANGSNLQPGMHGIHIHQTGKCNSSTGFKSAGGHLADDNDHGVHAEDGRHPGDLPNMYVGSDGKFSYETFIVDASVEDQWLDKVELFDEDGSAIVVHSGADDYESQPSGDAGTRVACGIVAKQ